jgi:hypothetical protein
MLQFGKPVDRNLLFPVFLHLTNHLCRRILFDDLRIYARVFSWFVTFIPFEVHVCCQTSQVRTRWANVPLQKKPITKDLSESENAGTSFRTSFLAGNRGKDEEIEEGEGAFRHFFLFRNLFCLLPTDPSTNCLYKAICCFSLTDKQSELSSNHECFACDGQGKTSCRPVGPLKTRVRYIVVNVNYALLPEMRRR